MRRLQRLASHGDSGQAFPIYITAVAGLLFLGLALFAVGQAGATRNGAQTAADAAALAAAQEQRDALREELLAAIGHGDAWQDVLDGIGAGSPRACDEARWFAGENDADVTECALTGGLTPTFHVAVRTRYTVGDSIVPGTESQHARAEATAVIEPRCVRPPGEPEPAPSTPPTDDAGTGGGTGGDDPGDDGDHEGDDTPDEDPRKPPAEFTCDGEEWSIDPERPGALPEVADLFSVHLAD
ncbi:pilus assembly protein TadG-related protein [Streptomyces sp. NPDC057702]|uniref:pilus assembly protein TadG-related protein n=1 Tax=unclassified Streptomyces TaxID=2593676 RepID=UPI0036CEDB4E